MIRRREGELGLGLGRRAFLAEIKQRPWFRLGSRRAWSGRQDAVLRDGRGLIEFKIYRHGARWVRQAGDVDIRSEAPGAAPVTSGSRPGAVGCEGRPVVDRPVVCEAGSRVAPGSAGGRGEGVEVGDLDVHSYGRDGLCVGCRWW